MTSVSRYGSAFLITRRLPSNSEFSPRKSGAALTMCEGHCGESGVAGALGREDALDHRDLAHFEPEIDDRDPIERRRDRLCLRRARVLVNPCELEVGRERSIIEVHPPAPEAGLHPYAKLDHAQRTGGHAEPHHARPSPLRKTARAIEIQ